MLDRAKATKCNLDTLFFIGSIPNHIPFGTCVLRETSFGITFFGQTNTIISDYLETVVLKTSRPRRKTLYRYTKVDISSIRALYNLPSSAGIGFTNIKYITAWVVLKIISQVDDKTKSSS